VPVGLITGDRQTVAEADPFLPDAERVVVKDSFTRFGAANLHPDVACELIAAGARRAVERLAAGPGQVWEIASGGTPPEEDGAVAVLRPPPISRPAVLEVHMQTADMAEVASWVRGVERTGTRAVRISGEDPLAMFRSFVALTYITRVSEGR
jgi:D-amino peptidase